MSAGLSIVSGFMTFWVAVTATFARGKKKKRNKQKLLNSVEMEEEFVFNGGFIKTRSRGEGLVFASRASCPSCVESPGSMAAW